MEHVTWNMEHETRDRGHGYRTGDRQQGTRDNRYGHRQCTLTGTVPLTGKLTLTLTGTQTLTKTGTYRHEHGQL
jgi:hypothetical protein